jgi:hypothetical protein
MWFSAAHSEVGRRVWPQSPHCLAALHSTCSEEREQESTKDHENQHVASGTRVGVRSCSREYNQGHPKQESKHDRARGRTTHWNDGCQRREMRRNSTTPLLRTATAKQQRGERRGSTESLSRSHYASHQVFHCASVCVLNVCLLATYAVRRFHIHGVLRKTIVRHTSSRSNLELEIVLY